MDLSKYKYSSTFTSTAKVVNPSEQDRFIAKASLAPLKGILPADVNPDDDQDLLYIVANDACSSLMNANGDAISAKTALAIYKSAKNKYINVDRFVTSNTPADLLKIIDRR